MMDWKSKQKPLRNFWTAFTDKSKITWYYEAQELEIKSWEDYLPLPHEEFSCSFLSNMTLEYIFKWIINHFQHKQLFKQVSTFDSSFLIPSLQFQWASAYYANNSLHPYYQILFIISHFDNESKVTVLVETTHRMHLQIKPPGFVSRIHYMLLPGELVWETLHLPADLSIVPTESTPT